MAKKKPSTEKLKLMRWAEANYPPVDLNKQVTHVNELIQEVRKLRKEKQLLQRAIELQKRTLNLLVSKLPTGKL